MRVTKNKNIKVVSLFSGCGGADLGLMGGFKYLNRQYPKLPYEILWANDNDPFAAETYKKNFKHSISSADIKTVGSSEIPNHEILLGGFPCQSFSMVGQRKGFGDPRGKLYLEMVRILKDKKPAAFIGENVKGLISVQGGKVFRKIIEDFENVGYKVFYKVLNASEFGVPQKRERVFIIGIRKDLNKVFKFPNRPQVSAVLKDILQDHSTVDKKYFFSPRAVAGLKRANKAFNKGRVQNTMHPCNTISTHLAKVSLNGTDPVLGMGKDKYRRITPLEATRIQSFPEDFVFEGSDAKKYIQIGNAVPPVLMWYIAKEVFRQVFAYGRIHKRKEKSDNVPDQVEEYFYREESVPFSAAEQGQV